MFPKIKNIISVGLMFSLALSTQLWADNDAITDSQQETAQEKQSNEENSIAQSDLDEQNKMSDPKSVPTPSASDSVEDWANDVLANFGVESFGENNGKFILFAQQSVSLKPTDPQYGDAVINAFEMAMMKIQEQYIMNLFGKITVDKVKSSFKNMSTDAKEIELPPVATPGFLGKVIAVFNKGLDVTEKKLDEELIEMGVDAATLAKATPTEKKDIFRDKFIKTTMRKASGSIAGLVPVQTTIVRDAGGNTAIGIVAIVSDKTIQIAKDIMLQRDSRIRGKGKDIISLLPSSEEEYVATMGVRLVYDLDGTPAIISYGVASYNPDSGDDYINEELKSEAKKAAIANADAQIAEMINGRMNSKNERQSGEEIRKYVERELKTDADTIEKTVKNIIKISSENSKSSASAKLQGVSTVKTWRYNSEDGLKMVGAVRVWRYSTLEAVNSFNKSKVKKDDKSSKKQNYDGFKKSSKPVNNINDF